MTTTRTQTFITAGLDDGGYTAFDPDYFSSIEGACDRANDRIRNLQAHGWNFADGELWFEDGLFTPVHWMEDTGEDEQRLDVMLAARDGEKVLVYVEVIRQPEL